MSIRIQRNHSKTSLCQFTIHFHNEMPLIKTSNKEQNTEFGAKNLIFQQDLSPSLLYTVNVFQSHQPKPLITNSQSLSNNFSLPQKTALLHIQKDTEDHKEEQYLSQQQQTQNISLSHSFIEQLLLLEEEQKAVTTVQKKKKHLQYLDIEQTQSMQQQDSQYFQEQHSQIVQLTEEEKNFFNNFIVNSEEREESPFKFNNYQQISLQMKSKCILQEKKRLIRNFFRPKGSFLKDDRTSCNSYTNIDQFYDSSKKSQGSKSQWVGVMKINQNQVIGS